VVLCTQHPSSGTLHTAPFQQDSPALLQGDVTERLGVEWARHRQDRELQSVPTGLQEEGHRVLTHTGIPGGPRRHEHGEMVAKMPHRGLRLKQVKTAGHGQDVLHPCSGGWGQLRKANCVPPRIWWGCTPVAPRQKDSAHSTLSCGMAGDGVWQSLGTGTS
jgi:hypothetical protein